MARHPEGWKLVLRDESRTYLVRFSHGGKRILRSTGEQDRGKAAAAAAQIYADHVAAHPASTRAVGHRGAAAFEKCLATWIASEVPEESTRETYMVYAGHWVQFFESLGNITSKRAKEYVAERLKVVLAKTVNKEVSALRGFVAWAHGHTDPDTGNPFVLRKVQVPRAPEDQTGKRWVKRSKPVKVSARDVDRIIRVAPEWSRATNTPPFPVRAFLRILYETALRPAMMEKLRVPEHYAKGRKTIKITKALDPHAKWEREVPLSSVARAELDRVISGNGLIFGRHDYRLFVAEAAWKILPRAQAEAFSISSFRAARIRHLAEIDRSGARFVAGIKHDHNMKPYVEEPTPAEPRGIRALIQAGKVHKLDGTDKPSKRAAPTRADAERLLAELEPVAKARRAK